MRKPDYSVRGYAGQTIESTDPDYIADPDPTNDLGITVDGGGGGGGTVGFGSLFLLIGMSVGNVTGGGGPSADVGFRSLMEATGMAVGNNASGGGGGPTVGFASLFDVAGVATGLPTDFARISWTTIPALDPDDREIWVDSVAGSNGNSGLAINLPKQTLAAGLALLRGGNGDRLWLKKGSTFSGADGTLNHTEPTIAGSHSDLWSTSGFSSTRPIIIGAYGTGAQPQINTGTGTLLTVNTSNAGPGAIVQHVWFMDFEAYAGSYDHGTTGAGPSAFNWNISSSAGGGDLLFENLKIHDFGKWAFYFSGQLSGGTASLDGVTLRGCTVYDIAHYSNGITDETVGNYVFRVNNLHIEFYNGDQVGWMVPEAQSFLKRHWYFDETNGPVELTNSLLIKCDGTQVRPGGTVTHNVFSHQIVGLSVGRGSIPVVGGVTVTCEDNVTLHGQDPTNGLGGQAACWGLSMSNIVNSSVQRNIVAHGDGVMNLNPARALHFDKGGSTPPSSFTCKDSTVAYNILYDWGGYGLYIPDDSTYYLNVELHHNVCQNPSNTHFYSGDNGAAIYLATSGIDVTDFVTANNRYALAPGATQQVAGAYTTFSAFFAHFEGGSPTSTGPTTVTYVDPSRDIASYHGSIGGTATLAAFETAVRAMSKDNWDDRLTAPAIVAYMKAGFTEV
jgi:hypothetical protein